MCQAIAQGGRRCPIHRRETMILLGNISEKTTLKDQQVRQLFSELRREGRHSLSHGEDYWNAYLDSMTLSTRDENVAREVERARKEGHEPDGATLYALRRFQARAVQRSLNLESKLSAIATAKGWSEKEAREKFNTAYNSVDTSRGAKVPEEFTTSAVREARAAGLSYDKQTVVALARLNDEKVEFERVPRVTRQEMSSASIAEAGYGDGRLEVVFHSNPDRVYAYQNVPERVWNDMRSESAGSVFSRQVRGVPTYRYASQEESDADAHRVRCTGCGQFVAASGGHTCPVHETAEEARIATEAKAISKEEAAEKAPVNPPAPIADTSGIDAEAVQRQLNPPRVEPAGPVAEFGAEERGFLRRRREIIAGGSDLTSLTRYYADEFTEEDKARISNAPVNAKILLGFEVDEEGKRIPVNGRSDSFKRKIDFISENDEHTFDYSGYGVIRVYEKSPSTIEKLAQADFNKQRDAEKQARDNDHSVIYAESTSSTSRQYKPDGNAAAPSSVSWAKVRDFRKHINEGKAVRSSLEWKFTAPRYGAPRNPRLDDQGHEYPRFDGNTVSGHLTMRRKADGTMETVYSKRSLKCNCWSYRRNYHCEHVDYVQRHAANLGQQMMGDPNSASASGTRRPVERVETALGQIPRSFYSRPEVQIKTDEKTGDAYVAFAARSYRSRRVTLTPTESVTRSYNFDSEEDKKAAYVGHALSNIHLSGTPAASSIRQGLRYGPVEVPVDTGVNLHNYGAVSGSVRMEKDEDGNIITRSRSLRCSCMDYRRNYDCAHVRVVGQGNFTALLGDVDQEAQERMTEKYNEMYNSQGGWRTISDIAQAVAYNTSVADVARIRTEREAEERRIAEEARQRREARNAARRAEEMRSYEEKIGEIRENAASHRSRIAEKWNNREEGYTENSGAFHEDFNEAIARKKRGEEIIPFKTENVTDGIAADEPGALAFGVELEFDIKSGVNKRQALEKIASELYAAGLTERDYQTHYHAATNQSEGAYTKWSFEEDCTVAGELVSPILKDTPEHWSQLKTAVEIITRNGGIASTRAGSHVHVSSANYENSTAKHVELLRTVKANEDTLYRAASNPSRGTHRGIRWCSPNSAELTDGREITKEVRDGHNLLGSHYHGAALNMGASSNTNNPKASNVEFRMWDSTLDPGMIQQQIAYSVAMTDRADRVVEETGSSKFPEKRELLGSARRNGVASSASDKDKLEREPFLKENGHAGAFIDSLFRRKEDRQRATALFAVNNWV